MNHIRARARYRAFWEVPADQAPGKTGGSWDDLSDLEEILSGLNVLPYGRVLDVGCGTGRLSQLVKHGYYFGVDIAQGMIDFARSKHVNAARIDGPEDIHLGDPLLKFSWVMCLSVFTHLPREERRRYLARFREIGLRLVVDVLVGEEGGSIDAWYADGHDFRDDLEEAGWRVIRDFRRQAASGYIHTYFRCV